MSIYIILCIGSPWLTHCSLRVCNLKHHHSISVTKYLFVGRLAPRTSLLINLWESGTFYHKARLSNQMPSLVLHCELLPKRLPTACKIPKESSAWLSEPHQEFTFPTKMTSAEVVLQKEQNRANDLYLTLDFCGTIIDRITWKESYLVSRRRGLVKGRRLKGEQWDELEETVYGISKREK